ncbi:MAG: 16S rRNA processing protein RimM [Bdellovibrionaceae bacterium]|nr:16S rRNA processing protein RimM [Bdellovibrionales bacterium]MCB9083698.1 16S rRNA processing protein RimM [Pseudobdellovibrionaceae bacterium]
MSGTKVKSQHPPQEAQERGLRLVGKVKDAHGIRGELYVLIFSGETSWLQDLKVVQLYHTGRGGWLEIPLKNARVHKQGFIAKTETITDRNQAEELKGAEFFIPEEFLVSEPGETIYLAEIEGFSVIQKGGGPVGQIVGFSSNGPQDIIRVQAGDAEFEIPLVEEFIVEIRFAAKEIEMDLPEGLMEV